MRRPSCECSRRRDQAGFPEQLIETKLVSKNIAWVPGSPAARQRAVPERSGAEPSSASAQSGIAGIAGSRRFGPPRQRAPDLAVLRSRGLAPHDEVDDHGN